MIKLLSFWVLSMVGLTLSTRANENAVQVEEPNLHTLNVAEHPAILNDPTKAFNEAFNSSAKRVVVPCRETPYVVGPIVMTNGDKEIVLEPGVVIQAKPGAFKPTMACLIRLENANNVVIRGNGATLRMNRMEYREPDHRPSEHRHALAIAGCDDILVEDLTVEESGGDGVYIGGLWYDANPALKKSIEIPEKEKTRWMIPSSRNVTIRRVIADRNHRQGLSLITGENILIEDCVFKNTSGTPPMHGLCIEPAHVQNRLKNVVVRNCISEMNDSAGFSVYLRKLKQNSEPVEILIEDCEVRGSKGAGLVVGAIGDNKDSGVSARITFRNCLVKDTEKAGIYVYDKSFSTGEVVFDGCHLKNVAKSAIGGSSSPEAAQQEVAESRRPPVAPIVFYLRRQSNLTNHFGGIVFKDCQLEDDVDRPVIAQGAKVGPENILISKLSGTIQTSRENPVMNLGEPGADVTLTLVTR